jgi:hypothetical protein
MFTTVEGWLTLAMRVAAYGGPIEAASNVGGLPPKVRLFIAGAGAVLIAADRAISSLKTAIIKVQHTYQVTPAPTEGTTTNG